MKYFFNAIDNFPDCIDVTFTESEIATKYASTRTNVNTHITKVLGAHSLEVTISKQKVDVLIDS